jgi:murein DD-endopeptidase MepM/ murein hydrolase activator NlpD
MRIIILTALLSTPASTTFSQSQSPITVTAQDYGRSGVTISAQNSGYCPYTVVLTCDLQHMQSSSALPLRKLVLPAGKKVTLTHLTPEAGQAYRYNYSFKSYQGNTITPFLPGNSIYALPFEAGKEYRVIQANNGTFSHQGKQAIDFQMPENSIVCAARSGVVVAVKQDSNTGCPEAVCKDQGNYITVYHEDGTFATYVHFRQHGSLAQPGQSVAQGQAIGYSGNTGWSSGPHLHFEVDAPGEPEKRSIPVKFNLPNQTPSELQPGMSYKR